jgi:hypothetical protein
MSAQVTDPGFGDSFNGEKREIPSECDNVPPKGIAPGMVVDL